MPLQRRPVERRKLCTTLPSTGPSLGSRAFPSTTSEPAPTTSRCGPGRALDKSTLHSTLCCRYDHWLNEEATISELNRTTQREGLITSLLGDVSVSVQQLSGLFSKTEPTTAHEEAETYLAREFVSLLRTFKGS
jgi:hypothetical protein